MKQTSLEDRHLIKEMISQGLKSKEIAEQLGWSVKTVEKWRNRIRQDKLTSQIGRPRKGAMSQFSEVIARQVKAWRDDYRGWGGRTIRCEFSIEPRWQQGKIPSSATINRYLKQSGLVTGREKREPLPFIAKIECSQVHDLWQIDGQGNEQVHGVGFVSMLNIKDVISSLYVGIYPARLAGPKSHPTTRHYQAAIRSGAIYCGLPKQVQTDHASVFYDNSSKSPFPTLFSLWLIALGIEPVFSRIHRPQDQGKVERSHQTIWKQMCRQTPYHNWENFYEKCQQRRIWLNEFFDSSATDNKPPLIANPKAKHSGRVYHPSLERNLLALDLVYDYLEKGKWWRRISKDGTFSLGKQVYYLPGVKPKAQAEIRFRKSDQSLLICLDNELCFRTKIKGIALDDLIGELHEPIPGTQLEIPFLTSHITTTL